MFSTYKFGIFAEIFVYLLYIIKFYTPLKRRYRNYFGEIDLIFTKGRSLCFIEVKARSSNIQEVITNKQIKRIKQSAAYFIASNPQFANYDVRFDLAIVRPWLKAHIIKNII